MTQTGTPATEASANHGSRSTVAPTEVSTTSMVLGASGFFAIGLGETLRCWAPSGVRVENVLLIVGTLVLGAAILSHVRSHRSRFGLVAVVLVLLATVLAAVMWLPAVIDPAVLTQETWTRFAYDAWGIAWILGSLATFAVIVRKEQRQTRGGTSEATEIHATYSTLVILAAGMLIYGLGFAEPSSNHNSHFDGLLTVLGPALIAIAVITHFEHLSAQIGRLAVSLIVIGTGAWALKNFTRVFTDWMTDPDAAKFLVYGVQGIIYFLGAVACLSVLAHKKSETTA